MRQCRNILLIVLSGHWFAVCATAAEPDPELPASATIRQAIERSIPRLESGSAGSADERQCFTCHSQAVPVLALSEALRQDFAVDRENLRRQLVHTSEHLKRGQEDYAEGRGQGGQVLTAGYALWALTAGDWEPDAATAAVTSYLLHRQREDDHWHQDSKRPPTSGSPFTASYVALRGLQSFGTPEQQPRIEARTTVVREWIRQTAAVDTEDRVFRLLALRLLKEKEATGKQATALVEAQRADGGWAQLAAMESDAYATATVLYAMLGWEQRTASDPNIRRGIQYLLKHQLEDGSWHVVSRAEGFQDYFESGFPHGDDQFISIAATGWATLALLHAVSD